MSDPCQESFTIDKAAYGARMDVFLHERYPAISRAAIQRLLDNGDIRVDGHPVKPSHSAHVGERVDICWPVAKSAVAQPEEMPLNILFEDSDLVVVNKPPGMVVHPAAGNEEHTLVNALLHHCAGDLSGIGGVARPGIVHRLDKDTSGCLVVAKNDAAHLALSGQFERREVEKRYDAIVCGELKAATGEIRAAIARHPVHRKRMAVTQKEGRDAWTSYQAIKTLRGATLVEIRLHTGRTHQIRVHFQHLGHPLVGDATYGEKLNKRFAETTGYTAPRQLLHAHYLAFTHPRSGQTLRFEAPWPEDFAQAVKILGNPRELL